MAETVIEGIDGVMAAVGRHLGYSDWLELTQEQMDGFSAATGDGRAEFLTLSLVNHFLPQVVEVRGISMGINYGANRVRFPAPVEAGARLRGGAELVGAEEVAGGVQATMVVTVEMEGGNQPACVVEALSRYLA